jgi:putative flippase GtrA
MFESLDDQMKHDAQAEASTKERLLKYVIIGVVSVVVVGGIFAVQFIK